MDLLRTFVWHEKAASGQLAIGSLLVGHALYAGIAYGIRQGYKAAGGAMAAISALFFWELATHFDGTVQRMQHDWLYAGAFIGEMGLRLACLGVLYLRPQPKEPQPL